MASLQLRSDKSDDSTGEGGHLREIALRGTTAQWREAVGGWAKVQMFARAK